MVLIDGSSDGTKYDLSTKTHDLYPTTTSASLYKRAPIAEWGVLG